MDAITLLKEDHHNVEQLFKRFESSGHGAHRERQHLTARVIEALSVHSAIEEQVFYPFVRANLEESAAQVLEGLEEHHVVKLLLSELESSEPTDERFAPKMAVLIESVRRHVKEEEGELFASVRSHLARGILSDLGEAMLAARNISPTHPHPRSPDTPPANRLLGPVLSVAEHVGDTVSGAALGALGAIGDLLARVTPLEAPSRSTRGNSAARHNADVTRSRLVANSDAVASSARDIGHVAMRSVSEGVRNAKQTTEDATSSAARATREVTESAREALEETSSDVKKTARSASRTASATTSATRRARTSKSPVRKAPRPAPSSRGSKPASRPSRSTSATRAKSAGA